MSYSNVPPPDCLSSKPSTRSEIEDRRKDDQKVQDV
jgi:hypothetical protein